MDRRGTRRFADRFGGVRPFSPTQISGLTLWLRADLGITIATGVSAWADQSGSGNNVTQVTGAKQPTYNASGGPNGLAYVQGVKASNTSLGGTFTWNQPVDLFLVGQWGGSLVSGDSMVDGHGGNTGRIYWSSAGTINFGADGGVNILQATGVTETNWNRYEAQWNGVSGAASVGNIAAVQFAGTGDGTSNPAGITLFNFGDATSAPSNSNLAEVIGYSRILTASERGLIQAYQKARFGVT